jgi:cytochrome c oxidase subunit 2
MKEFFDISGLLGLPESASAHAADIDFMMALVHWLMLLLFVGWGAYFIYVLFRFRASKQPVASYEGAVGKYSKYQESAVVLAEATLLVVFAFPIWGLLKNEFPAEEESFNVHVIAEQFAWNVHYPGADGVFGARDIELIDLVSNPIGIDYNDPAATDDIVTVNELHLPVNRSAIVKLTSKDVIHSFGVPQLRIKQDAIPGLEIPIWFTPTVSGEYEIACAQLCGLSHYRMRGFVTVEPQSDVDSWLQEIADENALYN